MSLVETLRTMSADVVADASITLPLDGRGTDANVILEDTPLAQSLSDALAALVAAARGAARV